MSDPTPDLETVTLQGTYRIGYAPPAPGTLAAGEIYIQVPADGAAPVFFVGGLENTVVSMVTGPPPAARSAKTEPKVEPKAEEHGSSTPPPKR